MKVLSLFDGMSCCQIALNRAGIPYDNYFASEIDKHVIKVTQSNYPDTIQLGDITKWREWDLPQIDLLVFGSPCQGFSFAGAGLNFDEPRSALFFTAADILDTLKPKFFLMENVRMLKWCERIITERLDVDSIFIDSALVSAQTRKRLYWTNIPVYGKPKDKQIFLKDILETEVDEKYYLKPHLLDRLLNSDDQKKKFSQIDGDKAITLLSDTSTSRGTFVKIDTDGKPKANQDKASAFSAGANSGGNHSDMDLTVTHNLQPRTGKGNGGKGHLAKTDQKSYCVDTANGQAVEMQGNIRRLTEIEVERLQTVPDRYTAAASPTQRYKMLGNGMTVDVIAWILEFMKDGEPRNCGILQRGLF